MKRLLLFLVIGVVFIGGGVFSFFFLQKRSLPNLNPNDQIKQLSTSVSDLQKQVNGLKKSIAGLNPVSSQSAVTTATEARIKALESSMANLQSRVRTLENQSPVKLSENQIKAPLYIPIGSSGSSIATDWQTLDTPQVAIDPADYPGYTSMQLVISLKVDQGNGQAFARLVDSNENIAILTSEVSTKNQDYDLLASQNFQLPQGKKTYRIALKTLTGYTAQFQNASIRVNY